MSCSKETLDPLAKIAESGVHFTIELYKHHVSSDPGNVFFSPFSLSVALAMTFAGASNQTAAQMRDAMKLDIIGEDSDVHSSFASLLSVLSKVEATGITLRTANRMYVHNQTDLIPEFQKTVEDQYASTTAVVDFAADSEGVRQTINGWVEKVTKNKIRSLLAKGILTALTRLVLVNAVYFKGDWANKFDPVKTVRGTFYPTPDAKIVVSMMQLNARFSLGDSEELKCRVIELPYNGRSLSMFIVLPDDRDGLAEVEEKLTPETLKELLSHRHSTKVALTLPKFKLERTIPVIDLLMKMGINDLFSDGKADLSGINGGKDLYVSAVVHKAFCEVNEKGSEAAAATAVVIAKRSLEKTIPFAIDHPFLFFIQENTSGTLLFFGRVLNPNLQ